MIDAYSYIRFSSMKQHQGDSLERQQKMINKWIEKNPDVTLHEKSFKDLAVSGYTGKHLTTEEGLGAFRDAVIQGRIKSGSILVVEAIDRLGRQEVTEQAELLLNMINKGITIYTLEDDCSYSKESVKDDASKIYVFIGKIQSAHDFSDRLSRRLLSSRETTRENVIERFSKPVDHNESSVVWITQNCPSWIQWVGSGEIISNREKGYFKLIASRARVVKTIFELYLGGMGTEGIAKKLNKEGVKSFNDKGWHSSYINKILLNRQAIGELTLNQRKEGKEDIVEGYYPSAITRDLYLRAQSRKKLVYKNIKVRDKNKPFDLFFGLVRCGVCGSEAKSYNKGKGYFVYQCCANKRGNCGDVPSSMANRLHIDHHVATFITYRLAIMLFSNKDEYFEPAIRGEQSIVALDNTAYLAELDKRILLANTKYDDAVLDDLGVDEVSLRREQLRELNRELRDYNVKEREAKEDLENEQYLSFNVFDIQSSHFDWINWMEGSVNKSTGVRHPNLVNDEVKMVINQLLKKLRVGIYLYKGEVVLKWGESAVLTIKKPKRTVMDSTSYSKKGEPFLRITGDIDEPLAGYDEEVLLEIKDVVRTLTISSEYLLILNQNGL
jgi:hypothetical protein